MKYKIFFIGLIMLTVSCKNKPAPAEITMKQIALRKQLIENREVSAVLERDAGRSMRRDVQEIAAKGKKLIAWREKFYNEPGRKNLITYTDSVLAHYELLDTKVEQVVTGFRTYRDKVLENSDSTDILNLKLYALYAEQALLDRYVSDMGLTWHGYTTMFPTRINKAVFSAGDTVFVIVNTFSVHTDWKINFDQVTCVNDQSGITLRPKVTQLKEFYLLRYLPTQKGKYEIRGPVAFYMGTDEEESLPIANEFVVN